MPRYSGETDRAKMLLADRRYEHESQNAKNERP